MVHVSHHNDQPTKQEVIPEIWLLSSDNQPTCQPANQRSNQLTDNVFEAFHLLLSKAICGVPWLGYPGQGSFLVSPPKQRWCLSHCLLPGGMEHPKYLKPRTTTFAPRTNAYPRKTWAADFTGQALVVQETIREHGSNPRWPCCMSQHSPPSQSFAALAEDSKPVEQLLPVCPSLLLFICIALSLRFIHPILVIYLLIYFILFPYMYPSHMLTSKFQVEVSVWDHILDTVPYSAMPAESWGWKQLNMIDFESQEKKRSLKHGVLLGYLVLPKN